MGELKDAIKELAADCLHDHGPMYGEDEQTAQWRDCRNGPVHEAVSEKITDAVMKELSERGHI